MMLFGTNTRQAASTFVAIGAEQKKGETSVRETVIAAPAPEIKHDLVTVQLRSLRAQIDRGFAMLLSVQWLLVVVVAFLVSPLYWHESAAASNSLIVSSLLLSTLATGIPLTLAVRRPGATLTRHTVAGGQMIVSAVLMHLTHGHIEMHLHMFVSLALLAFYFDPLTLLTAFIVAASFHTARTLPLPDSPLGPYAIHGNTHRWLEHAAWAMTMDLLLFFGIRRCLEERTQAANQQSELAAANALLAERTQQLSLGEERFRQLTENIRQVFIMTEVQDGRTLYVSPAFRALWGHADGAEISFDWTHAFEERERVRSVWQQAAQGERASTVATLLRPNGECRFARIEASPVFDLSSRVYRVALIVEDVTDRRRGEDERARAYRRERRIAAVLQDSVLERAESGAFPGLSVETFYRPAHEEEAYVCGDFFDAFPISDGSVALVVGDVSGKGLDAATHMTEAKYALRAYLKDDADPASVFAKLNRFVCDSQSRYGREDATVGRFVALALAIIDPKTGAGSIARAGTEPPLIWRADRAAVEIVEENGGLPIGVLEEAEYVATPIQLEDGDVLMMVTDGITEARSTARILLGLNGLVSLIKIHCPAATDLWDAGERIMNATMDYAGGRLSDDACCLLVSRNRNINS